jgi:hypothetical protein
LTRRSFAATSLSAALLAGCHYGGTIRSIPALEPPDATVAQLMQAYELQSKKLRGVRIPVSFEGEIPALKNKGQMRAVRTVSAAGKVEYSVVAFEGDDRIRKDVIFQYMRADADPNPAKGNAAVTPQNYRFENLGRQRLEDGTEVVVLRLTPREKRVGLFRGELWLDPSTLAPVRERGVFVKSPSVFFKRVEFRRDFRIFDGVSIPAKLSSRIQTRIVGEVSLDIQFGEPEPVDSAS